MPPVIIERERVRSIVGGFYDVYNYYGFGFVEPVYAGALTRNCRTEVIRWHERFRSTSGTRAAMSRGSD